MGLSSKDVAAATAAEDMTFHWSQIGGELDMAAKPPSTGQASPRKKQQQPVVLKCPRCKSTNTKFCYYNNYSRTQPRHFCRACKRHWTEGGTLRNVPVGGSSGRKNNKRARTTKSSNVDSHQHQHQQQEVAASAAAPFGLQLDNEFTDTLRQLVCQQQQQFPSSLLPLPSDYTDIEQVCAPPPYDPGNPFSNATPPSCSTGQELVQYFTTEPSQMQQLSYWNFWDFGMTDLSTQELLGQAEGLQ